ncbi:Hsp20/alpha crystallin family protein [Enhydrobacter sp.]|jgi:HSP20 family protein|uniref:Hsp20/alpha crystallin family protein n=1 Tax=Enhydrobacter sp. TaxID=1894999 RepID=UPI002601AF63|nr:Hsp20/alpha crystallin family protein [Enhydrobacter sp.]WIM11929.1 MAG: hypothetical protein OJF58_002888 [Enhydrobacter sp.]
MTDTTKLPVSTEQKGAEVWRPFETLRQEVDRLFDDFGAEFWRSPFRRSLFDIGPAFRKVMTVGAVPPVDVVEKDDAYEVTADVPGFDEKNIEIRLVNGTLSIKGERKSEKEEKKEGRYLSEREFGSFERRFELPEGVDPDKIEASLKKGVLTVTLPKKPEAQKPAKKIEVKSAA